MAKLIMLIGVAGSGKSTVANKLKSIGAIDEIVSSDVVRAELLGDENEQNHNNEVFNEVHKRIRKFLKEEKNVCYDATNLSAKRRAAFLNNLSNLNIEKECIVVMTSFDDCVKRQNQRERKVPEEVIRRQIKQFQCPYYWEGWDKIDIIHTSHVPVLWFTEQNKIPHDNPHHTANVLDHMINAHIEYVERYGNDHLGSLATGYHDLAKYFCKEFKDKDGVTTKEAHYYGHQNASAYFYLLDNTLFHREGLENSIKIANLIQWHMEFWLRDEKGMEKLKKQLGKEMFTFLERIHICDGAAH